MRNKLVPPAAAVVTPAPAAMTVSQALLAYLAVEGVDTLFGVPGAAVMHLLDELKNQRDRFRYLVCRQETGAAYIADGYARVGGRLGVVVVTSGPGATNALTGTMNAQNDGTPLLTITGEVPEAMFGKGYLQEGIDASLDVDAVYANAAGYSAVVTNPSNFQTLFEQALRDALGTPGRASHISLPDDVAGSAITPAPQLPREPRQYRAVPRCADDEAAARAFERLVGVDRPLVFLGSGARDALRSDRLAAFVSFVEKHALPVMTTPDAKGIFPESHPLSLRNYGTGFCEWTKYYLSPKLFDPSMRPGYDALLVLGTTLGGFATNKWNAVLQPEVSLVQVDLDPRVIGRTMLLDFGAVAEIGAFIDRLVALGRAAPPGPHVEPRRAFVDRIHRERSPFLQPGERDVRTAPIPPQTLMRLLGDALPAGSNVFVDAGNSVGWCLHYLAIDPPSRMHNALAMGPMGFGTCAAIGGKLAAPESVCVAVTGDGAFLMHGSEVSTAAAYGIGAIWIVLDDGQLLMVDQGMNAFFPDPGGLWKDYYAIGRTDLARFAQALGADAYDVRDAGDFERAWGRAIEGSSAGRPQVIVAHIDTTQIPPYYQPME